MQLRWKKTISILLIGLIIFCLAVASGFVGMKLLQHEKRQSTDIEKLQNTVFSGKKEKEVILPEISQLGAAFNREISRIFSESGQLNGWQKLACGENISLLIVGDSIGAQEWTYAVSEWIEDNYQIKCSTTNLSMGGNGSYGGYVSEKLLPEEASIDLAIVCYGQNDLPESFAEPYEALIRELYRRNDRCSIVAVLESPQREYNEKMQTILQLAEYYNFSVADTIEAFNSSGYSYEFLTLDGIHPNERGQEIYAKSIEQIIAEQVKKAYQEKEKLVLNALSNREEIDADAFLADPIFKKATVETVDTYEQFRYFPSAEFRRINDTDWEIIFETGFSGSLGISRNMVPGVNQLKIYSSDNEEIYNSGVVEWKINFNLITVDHLIEETLPFEGNLQLSFLTKEAADQFFGLIFTDYTPA